MIGHPVDTILRLESWNFEDPLLCLFVCLWVCLFVCLFVGLFVYVNKYAHYWHDDHVV